MCWSEQISPLAHPSQATWQPFNLSHCIEMHNTHCWAAQDNVVRHISHIWLKFWHQAISLRLSTDNGRQSRVSRHTSFKTSRKNGNCRDAWCTSWYKYSLQVHMTIDPYPILNFYNVENIEIRVIWNVIHKFFTKRSPWNFGETRLCMREAIFVSC